MTEPILGAVYQAVRQLNEQLPVEKRLALSPKTEVVGSPDLDSSDIVNLLVMIEQQVEEELGVTVSLFEGRTVEQGVESFVTIEALVKFLAKRIAG